MTWHQTTIIRRACRASVCLTFDDGPHPEVTPPLLALLAQYGIKATFFLVGARVADHPGLVERIAEAGHCIGNHSYSHAHLLLKSKGFLAREIHRADRRIAEITGRKPNLFRPPYGQFGPALLGTLCRSGKKLVLWNFSAHDYRKSAKTPVLTERLTKMRPGQIVLLHDGHRNSINTLTALQQVLPTLLARDLSFKSLKELENG